MSAILKMAAILNCYIQSMDKQNDVTYIFNELPHQDLGKVINMEEYMQNTNSQWFCKLGGRGTKTFFIQNLVTSNQV